MFAPYREAPAEPVKRRRTLDPWMLALLFAWVCDLARIAIGLLARRPIEGELGFAGLLGATTLVVAGASLKKRAAAATGGGSSRAAQG
jgi:hypothetical protein